MPAPLPSDGGWAAFDVNNLEYYLNNIPFSDHGALLDPPTEDVTARCISMLAQLGETAGTSKAVADGIAYLRRTQLAEGAWYGRWGLNYIYGTWSVLCALNAAGARVSFAEITTDKGHDAFLLDEPELFAALLGRASGVPHRRHRGLRGHQHVSRGQEREPLRIELAGRSLD